MARHQTHRAPGTSTEFLRALDQTNNDSVLTAGFGSRKIPVKRCVPKERTHFVNWNFVGTSMITALAVGATALAGNVRIGDNLAAAVRFSNDLVLSCEQVTCTGNTVRPSFTSIASFRSSDSLSAPSLAGVNFMQPSNNSLPPALFTSIRAINLAISAGFSTQVVDNTSTVDQPMSSEPAPTTFMMSGGRINSPSTGWAYPGLPESTGAPRLVALGDNAYPDPIVSVAFNTYSTSIATSGDFPITTPSIDRLISVSTPLTVQAAAPLAASDPISTLFRETSPTAASDPGSGINVDAGSGFSTNTTPNTPEVPATPPVDSTPVDSPLNIQTPFSGSTAPTDTPEPATDLLIGTGLVAAGAVARRSRHNAQA